MKRVNDILAKITIEHLWIMTVMVAIFAFVNTHPIRPHDFWWHMAIGRDILTSGKIPATDLYSYTMPGAPYPSYTMFWLMEVVLYSVFRFGGAIAVILLQTALITSAYGFIALGSRRVSGSWRAAAFGTLFAAAMGFGNWNVRPQSVTYLYGAFLFWAVMEYRGAKTKRWLWLSPLVMALWVNSHGSFPIGLVILGCWLAQEAWNALRSPQAGWKSAWNALRFPLGILLVSSLACLLNPRGLGIIAYLRTMAGNTAVQNYILEWMPPNFNSLEGVIFYAGFLSLAVLMAVSPRRPDLFQVLTFCIFGALGLKYIRGVVWFGLAMAPWVALHLAELLKQTALISGAPLPMPRRKRLNAAFLLVLFLLAFFSLPWFKHLFPFTPQKTGLISIETPIQATNFLLEQRLPRNVFHDMAFGSYLIWAAQPAYPVFVDSRVELYPMTIWDDYWKLTIADSQWEQLAKQYQIHTLMLEPVKQAKLIAAADESPAWEKVYQDEQAVIFVKR